MARNAELEAAIVGDPEAEGPYVVYSDWLLAQGDPRGELIAVQLALETAAGARWAALKQRELELLRDHAGALLGPAAALGPGERYDWRRGFIDRMHGRFLGSEGEDLMAHPSLALVRAVGDVDLDAIRRAAPPRLAELAVHHDSLAPLLALPGLRRLAWHASWGAGFEPVTIERCGLRALALPGDELARFRAGLFPDLECVRVSWGFSEDAEREAALAFVAETPRAALDVTFERDASAGALRRRAAGARRIATLRLVDVPAAGTRAIQPHVPGVRDLEVSGYASPALTRSDVEALPAADRLLRITRGLRDHQAVAALVALPSAATLEELALPTLDRAQLAALCRGRFPALRRLELGLDRIQPGDLDELVPAMPGLEELVIQHHHVRELARSRLAGSIRTLTLRPLGSYGLTPRALPSLAGFAQLRRVRLAGVHPMDSDMRDAIAAFDVAVELAPSIADVLALRL